MNMGQKTIFKIKGLDCHVIYQEAENSKQEILCNGNVECNNCCGLESCECKGRPIERKNREKIL